MTSIGQINLGNLSTQVIEDIDALLVQPIQAVVDEADTRIVVPIRVEVKFDGQDIQIYGGTKQILDAVTAAISEILNELPVEENSL
ncbi:hypothetical protein HOD30_05515 [Candidatus Peregrinibacteria bacterium]|jgi:hypothetical protein|nr:hypothetical protein [Candidatus Peregrinibacteria bacterium]MBT4631480.1 hypothetical protein [Candidatus Peregrinibacteria bacterium]MBT5516586.1 hypothetical protein [Candidatus Peregrinibacteria bacterium]MBT5823869.1 hypothetical protein [Candidatus Peregrinibacteria bacterium]